MKKIVKAGIPAAALIVLFMVSSRCSYRPEEIDETTMIQSETETAATVEPTTTAAIPETEPETEPLVIELPDKENLVGRLVIEELNLDEYVMQGDEYLDRDNDGNEALQGSLYLPGYSTGDCIFINGHTMKDGSMFGNLYRQREHLLGMNVLLQYENQETEFQIVKTYIVSGTDQKILTAIYNEEYQQYLSTYHDLEVNGKVLSMMCCEYSLNDGRLFVVAVETPQ